ncbi:aminotransferase class I/II-fold pyridoxal phosphate-dependent enzyme [Roseisolibacter sp. H3M3-2]|uniref:pyridoxal phosphate-dependent aminotransferase n=1 Tax=Roseisolibacter sp. H3M3-2 TaxID=3031323 RepID=UPI0023DBE94C|nr:aminotransferase class I/II-fold pyridoxal phosphate-dependent enzyme [Roseisolibacter sp. H3M3-2]MDF1503587.1 aminotransferase class I/II-fold pyridoxal phosphate-dependent enzyme [Roseisolibacter sp. H3M3-2]
MSTSRRSFLRTLGLSGAGFASASLIGARGREAFAAELRGAGLLADGMGWAPGREIRISSNENPRGPSEASLRAIRDALSSGSRYPFGPASALREAVAKSHGVKVENVLLGCGSTEILRMAVDAYCSPARPLVTAAPTFEEAASRAATIGAPVRAIPVDAALKLDLDKMRAAAPGSGLVFVNNPNNPTGTVHPAKVIEELVRGVLRESPDSYVMVDEAYHEYADDATYATAIPLALELPHVVVARTFSKAYGLAGLRVGYAIGRPDTLALMARHQLGINVNVLGAAAALGALEDKDLVAREQRLNREARAYTAKFFQDAGYTVAPSAANFLMVDIRRDPKGFADAARKMDVLVGRPFPPLKTHLRVSVGTMDEMRAATEVFKKVLAAPVAADA